MLLSNMLFMLDYHGFCFCSTLTDYLLNFTINSSLDLLSVRFSVLRVRKSNISQLSVHTELSDDVICQVVSFL